MDSLTQHDFILTLRDENGNQITKHISKGTPEAEIKKLIDASYNEKNTISEAIRDYERSRIN